MTGPENQIRRYRFGSAYLVHLVVAHYFFGSRYYRMVSFWWPEGWDDLSWRFVIPLVFAALLWLVTGVVLYRAFFHRKLVIELTPQSALSYQRSSMGAPNEELLRMPLRELKSVTKANEDWVRFELSDNKDRSPQITQFDFHFAAIRLRDRWKACELFRDSGFDGLAERTGTRQPRAPKFTIVAMIQFMTLIAILSAAYRITVLRFELHPLNAAITFAVIGFLMGLAVVFVGALRVAANDSPGAHRCVAMGGTMMAATIPATFLSAVLFDAKQLLAMIEPTYRLVGILPFLQISIMVLGTVSAAVWLIAYLYEAMER